MVDFLSGGVESIILPKGRSGIGVSVKAREIAAGNLNPQSMSRPDDVAGRPQVDHVRINHAEGDGRGIRRRVAEPGSDHSVLEVLGVTVGPDIHQLGGEIRIRRIR